LIAFAGQRTVDLMGVALRLGGFEIRDSGGWMTYQGFPKSLAIDKAIDRMNGDEREVVGARFRAATGRGQQGAGGFAFGEAFADTAPASEQSAAWEGYGTAIKPAIEPWILCRKPIAESSIARQVLATGTGALNIDGCRYPFGDVAWPGPGTLESAKAKNPGRLDLVTSAVYGANRPQQHVDERGRFPSNVYACPKPSRAERERGCAGLPTKAGHEAVGREEGSAGLTPRAGAGRTSDSIANFHSTVKAARLMRWLVRLVTPPGGVVLDPFTGSGTTGMAASLEGFDFIGAEMGEDFHRIATARIAHAVRYPDLWADTEPGTKKTAKPTGPTREDLERAGQSNMFGETP
ncbi:MAG: site-specific DNA-methyltransferase, partial [bacterium]|nr:site-specific DNA-methyltransferase [bacterium]